MSHNDENAVTKKREEAIIKNAQALESNKLLDDARAYANDSVTAALNAVKEADTAAAKLLTFNIQKKIEAVNCFNEQALTFSEEKALYLLAPEHNLDVIDTIIIAAIFEKATKTAKLRKKLSQDKNLSVMLENFDIHARYSSPIAALHSASNTLLLMSMRPRIDNSTRPKFLLSIEELEILVKNLRSNRCKCDLH